MHRVFAVFAICALTLLPACHHEDQPAESTTKGNSTDRSADGTTGTGMPAHIANDSAGTSTAIDTAALTNTTGSTGTAPLAVTGTTEVHGATTQTTETIVTPTTTTASVATPTDTSSTIRTPTGTTTRKH